MIVLVTQLFASKNEILPTSSKLQIEDYLEAVSLEVAAIQSN